MATESSATDESSGMGLLKAIELDVLGACLGRAERRICDSTDVALARVRGGALPISRALRLESR